MKKQSKMLTSANDNRDSNKYNTKDNELDMGRGTINHNFLAALVTSPAYRPKVVKSKKGKGAYMRNNKFPKKDQESYLIAA